MPFFLVNCTFNDLSLESHLACYVAPRDSVSGVLDALVSA